MPTIHLIDASPYIFRAYFSLPDSITSPDGRPMNAVYGFASFLLKYVEEEKPTHAAVAFDRSLTTSFRNEMYPAYKQQRELPPAELEEQIDDCETAARVLGFRTFADATFEADDLIATIIRRVAGRNRMFVIVTSDKDLAQLVSNSVEIYDYGKGSRLGPPEVEERLDVRPSQVADYLGLAGDAVDNIPGVRGVGPKTAAALLKIFGSIDEIYENIDEIPSSGLRGARSLAERLRAQEEEARLSKELATVSVEAPIEVGLRELVHRGPSADAEPTFADWGFGTIRQRLQSST